MDDARLSVFQGLRDFILIVADAGNDADTGDDDTFHFLHSLFLVMPDLFRHPKADRRHMTRGRALEPRNKCGVTISDYNDLGFSNKPTLRSVAS